MQRLFGVASLHSDFGFSYLEAVLCWCSPGSSKDTKLSIRWGLECSVRWKFGALLSPPARGYHTQGEQRFRNTNAVGKAEVFFVLFFYLFILKQWNLISQSQHWHSCDNNVPLNPTCVLIFRSAPQFPPLRLRWGKSNCWQVRTQVYAHLFPPSLLFFVFSWRP